MHQNQPPHHSRRSPSTRSTPTRTWNHTLYAVLLTALLALAACTQPVTPGAAPDTAPQTESDGEKVLRVALTTFPNALYLPQAAERNATNASWAIYDSLVWSNDEGALEGALATDWEISEDGTTYTFTLREGVTFHNGEPFNADAVVFAWEQGQDPQNQYFDNWTPAISVEAVDDYTVVVQTEEPQPLFLRVVAQSWGMIPPAYFNEVGLEGFLQNPVGTGPFRLVEWAQGDRIVLEKNEDYWREGYPLVDQVIFRPIPESATRVAAIQTGEVDIVTRLSAEEAASLEGTAGINIVSYPSDRVYYVAFNNLTTGVGQPTEDPRVRIAMNHAVDVEAIIDALFGGNARPATGLVTPANWGFDDSLEPFAYDPDLAREMLAEAGYPDGFSMDFACPAGAYTNFEQVCEAVQGYLAEVGIETDLNIMESGAFWDLEAAKELPPIFGDSWSATIGEALQRLIGALRGWDASYSAWEDPVILDLLDRIEVEVDDDARAALYVELQQYMMENPPFIYLYQLDVFEAHSDRVENHRPRAAEDYWLFYVDIAE